MQRLPLLAREAENRVIAAHPALDRVVQVGHCLCVLSQVFDPCAFPSVAFLHLVEADEGGGVEEVADGGLAAGFEEAGEGDDGLGGFDGWGGAVG